MRLPKNSTSALGAGVAFAAFTIVAFGCSSKGNGDGGGGHTATGASHSAGGGSHSAPGGSSTSSAGSSGASLASVSSTSASQSVVPGGVRWVGRVDASNPAAVKFAWSGSGFVAVVTGSKISVKLQTEGGTSSAYFQPVIDGKVGARVQVPNGAAQTVVLGQGLSAGDHTVELYRDTEGMLGDAVFSGFVDGTLKGAPPAPGRLLEVVGDSISCGYGNLGNEVHPPWDNTCGFTVDTEAAYPSYGAVLARALGAELSIVACSGWGMYEDLGGSKANVLASVYENALGTAATPKWGFSKKPDAVLINLGTNDSGAAGKDGGTGDPGQPYEDAYVSFLKTVRGHYPNAWIFLTIGPMTGDPQLTAMRTHLDHVVATVKASGDTKVMDIPIATQDSTKGTGCDYHPNVAEDQIMADALAPTIKSTLGW